MGVLTDRRILLVNEHEWVPFVRTIPLTRNLLVQGWQDDRTASLIFVVAGQSITISSIADRPLAQDLADPAAVEGGQARPSGPGGAAAIRSRTHRVVQGGGTLAIVVASHGTWLSW